jgi:hypothetical protein
MGEVYETPQAEEELNSTTIDLSMNESFEAAVRGAKHTDVMSSSCSGIS